MSRGLSEEALEEDSNTDEGLSVKSTLIACTGERPRHIQIQDNGSHVGRPFENFALSLLAHALEPPKNAAL